MPGKTWSYLTNPFATATEGSFRLMKKVSEFTYFALDSKVPPPSFAAGEVGGSSIPPDEVALYAKLRDDLKPLINNYRSRYSGWLASYADRKSQTSRFSELMLQLRSEKIQEWDITIQTVYKMKTPEYKRLLPNRRAPFQTGEYRTRLDALDVLNTNITGDTNFELDFRNEIAGFYEDLTNEYNKQFAEKTDTSYASHELEPARMALAKGLFSCLNQLVCFFVDDTEKVTTFFDLEFIRESEQTTFRRGMKPKETYTIFHRTLVAADTLRLQNDGKTELIFWLAVNEQDAPGETFATVAANTETIVTPTELGGIAGKYLKVKNNDEKVAGHYVLTVM